MINGKIPTLFSSSENLKVSINLENNKFIISSGLIIVGGFLFEFNGGEGELLGTGADVIGISLSASSPKKINIAGIKHGNPVEFLDFFINDVEEDVVEKARKEAQEKQNFLDDLLKDMAEANLSLLPNPEAGEIYPDCQVDGLILGAKIPQEGATYSLNLEKESIPTDRSAFSISVDVKTLENKDGKGDQGSFFKSLATLITKKNGYKELFQYSYGPLLFLPSPECYKGFKASVGAGDMGFQYSFDTYEDIIYYR